MACRHSNYSMSHEIDGVSFFKRCTNLVNIDNAIGPSQPYYSSQANGVNGSSQADQVDPQVLKKALEECIKEIEISTNQIKELDSMSSTLRQFAYQVLGFFLVFQGAMIAVVFNHTSFFDRRAFEGIPILSYFVGFLCAVANIDNAISAFNLERKIRKEKIRLQMYEVYKCGFLQYGVEFKFDEHQDIADLALSSPLGWRRISVVLFYIILVLYMLLVLIGTLKMQNKVISAKESALASAAPAPVSSAPVQSGNPGKTWCVAKAGSPDTDVMNGLNFACGPKGGADCGPIQAGGACFSPDTIVSHASFAYNTYYQNMGRNSSNCYFGGTSIITITDPSYSQCRFL